MYDSDVENSVKHPGLRSYQFEHRRVRQNEQQEASPEPYHCIGQPPTWPVLETKVVLNHFAIKLHV